MSQKFNVLIILLRWCDNFPLACEGIHNSTYTSNLNRWWRPNNSWRSWKISTIVRYMYFYIYYILVLFYINIVCRCIPIRQNIILLLGYFATEINGLCSDTEDTPVNDLETCKKAVDQIKKTFFDTYFKNRINRGNWSKGCHSYFRDGSYFMNFNRHETGSTNKKSRQICLHRNKK